MAEPEQRWVEIRWVGLRRVAALGAIFGFLAGILSLLIISIFRAGVEFDPTTITLKAGLLEIVRPWPVDTAFLLAWPFIGALANAAAGVVIALLYNIIAMFLPLRIRT